MKKIISLIFFLVLSLLLTSCGDKQELSTEEISEKIQSYLDAKSFETSMHLRLVTDEMDVTINPLLTMSKYTNDSDQTITRLAYHNKLMEGAGLDAFELIYDEVQGKIYFNNTEKWYQGSIEDTEAIFGSNEIDTEVQEQIDFVSETVFNAIKAFKNATFVEVLSENERKLVHYELEYNLYDVFKTIFDHFNEENDLGYDDFVAFLKEGEVDDLFELFKTFKVDVYFDLENKNQLSRVELELMHIFNNDLVTNKIQDLLDKQDPENKIIIKKMFEYVKHFEIGVNINKLNTLDEIQVPDAAKNGLDIKFMNAPFDPKEVTHVSMNNQLTVEFSQINQYKWYSFTVPLDSQILFKFQYGSPSIYLYDQQFRLVQKYDYNSSWNSYVLKAGTYYFAVHAYKVGTFKFTIM